MTKVKVSKQYIDEELFIKSEKLRINNKSIQTPIKSFDMKKLRRDTDISSLVRGVNEIFKEFKTEKIEQYIKGERNSTEIYKELNTSLNKTSNDDVNFCFIALNDSMLPDDKGINLITDIAYNISDATPLPLVEFVF
ncbi:MAG: conserved hypothetical protein partial [Methanobrevibacter sp. CfCl-M3]